MAGAHDEAGEAVARSEDHAAGWAQGRGLPTPAYREVERTGPHHNPEFRVAVDVANKPPAEGIGRSKRAAEQAAAAAMLTREGVDAANG